MIWYRIDCGHGDYAATRAALAAAFEVAMPNNVLSENVNEDTTQSVIKAPAGLGELAAVLEVYTAAPVAVVTAPGWAGQDDAP